MGDFVKMRASQLHIPAFIPLQSAEKRTYSDEFVPYYLAFASAQDARDWYEKSAVEW